MPTSVDKFIFLHKYFQPTQAEQFVDEGRFDIPGGVGNSISQAEQGLDSVHFQSRKLSQMSDYCSYKSKTSQ